MSASSVVTPPTALFDSTFDTVFGAATVGTSSLVPDPYVVAINGHAYQHDLEFKPWKRQAMRATTTQITRTQADTSNEPGEQSLSTESLWRRTQDSWHEGASQVYLDRKNSSEFSFRSSKGIDPWTQWQLKLLKDTTLGAASTNANLALAAVGTHVYFIDGQALKYTNDFVTIHTVTGTPGVTASSICTDGHNVWVAYGSSGIYTTTEAAGAATQYVTTAVTSAAVVRFVLGRLMVGDTNNIYNVTASGALPTALGVSNYSNIVWSDFAEGNGVIFASGNSNNVGIIYSIQINTDASALASPIVCGQLPNGETVNAIYGYAGSGVAVGTNLGWRFAEQALANGVAGTVSLTIGPLTTTPNPVTSFSGYSRFIWGTYENYDGSSTGLFRMDPSVFVSDLAPAWASDRMAATQGVVNSVIHFNGIPVFAVAGVGIYWDLATYVVSGTIDSGYITYGLADNKMPVFVDIATQPLQGSVTTSVSLDDGSFTPIGTSEQLNSVFDEFPTPQVLANTIEIRETLVSDATHMFTPTLTRHTLRAIPASVAPTDWNIVIQLRENVLIKDVTVPQSPSAEYNYLDGLRAQKTICILQVGLLGPYTVTIESIDFIPEQWASLTGELNSVCVLTCRTVV